MPVTQQEREIIGRGDALSRIAQSPDGVQLKDILEAIGSLAYDNMLSDNDPLQVMRHRAVCSVVNEFLGYWDQEIHGARVMREEVVRRGDDPV